MKAWLAGSTSLMRALMDLAPEYSGQIVSYRKLQGQLDDAGNTTTLARYLDLLADAGLVTGLEKHSAKPYLSKRSTPKLNVLNTAIMTALHPNSFEHAREDGAFWGRLCESAVGAHLQVPDRKPLPGQEWPSVQLAALIRAVGQKLYSPWMIDTATRIISWRTRALSPV